LSALKRFFGKLGITTLHTLTTHQVAGIQKCINKKSKEGVQQVIVDTLFVFKKLYNKS
jgi:hypothetical protein